jgi:hypothetical protein
LPEAALVERLGGQVVILPLVEDRSTSSMIERIRRTNAEATARDWDVKAERNGHEKFALAGRS